MIETSSEKILVTGATGFVGRALIDEFIKSNNRVNAAVRSLSELVSDGSRCQGLSCVPVGNIDHKTRWQKAINDSRIVVHCAAQTIVTHNSPVDLLDAYRGVNVAGTLNLAKQAAAAGVRRFVFVSSIKVNGEVTRAGQLFNESSLLAPQDAYSQSKVEAEKGLLDIAYATGMEVVIIRPPLVVGPGVKGNLASMIKWVKRGLPLPLGAVHNHRSLVSLKNLVALLMLCADRSRSPQAVNQVFVVADNEDISTTNLLRKIAQASGSSSPLVPVPANLLRAFATCTGKRPVAERLLCNLQVDASKARKMLGWHPVVTLDQQLKEMFTCDNSSK